MWPPDPWFLNLIAFIGIMVLSVPTWSLNFRKKKLRAIQEALPAEEGSFRGKVREILKDKRGRDVSDWRQIDEICLFVGYFCLLGSSFARLWS